jgi:hypothetical protein
VAWWLNDHQVTKEDLTKQNSMESKTKFSTPVDRINKNFSGWSGVECEICGRGTTKAQYSYSMRFFKKPLCKTCQSLEKYGVEI